MIAEWLAVFYPRKFCVGQVIDLTKNNDLTIEFLDRCPGEVFVDWSDTDQEERKYVFLWKTTATLKRTTKNSVPISSIQLKFMMRKCDLEAIITKTQETLDRVDEWRGILLLYSVRKSSKTWVHYWWSHFGLIIHHVCPKVASRYVNISTVHTGNRLHISYFWETFLVIVQSSKN